MLLEMDRQAALGSETLFTAFMWAAERFILGIPFPPQVRVLM